MSASATDNSKVTRVEFCVNNNSLGASVIAPCNYPWRVPAKNGASYKVQAKVYDAVRNTAAQAVTFPAQ